MHLSKTAPMYLKKLAVLPEWIDYNDHMNLAFYIVAFDQGIDVLYDSLGLGTDYLNNQNASTFTLELHVNYLGEVALDDPLDLYARVMDYDHKRMQIYLEMYHAEKHYLAATMEQIGMHIDMSQRRSAPFPEAILSRIKATHSDHSTCPEPVWSGRKISIRK
ncbi:MAG: acyl-CoA thioester hydrolase [Parasphingorhabdus sp.]|jgi:acyl-CoA thioester hydrolase